MLAKHFFKQAATELNVEPKRLRPEAEEYITKLPWPGNVRQLENTCRWLTVMASGREIHINDLPPEMLEQPAKDAEAIPGVPSVHWQDNLRHWADQELLLGRDRLLDRAVPQFERIMIEAALHYTQGRRRDASNLLGWGRNTLTRKIKELGMGGDDLEE